MKRRIIRRWSALLECRVCGCEQERREYGTWSIGSSTIAKCTSCGKTTNHVIVGQIIEEAPYEDPEAAVGIPNAADNT